MSAAVLVIGVLFDGNSVLGTKTPVLVLVLVPVFVPLSLRSCRSCVEAGRSGRHSWFVILQLGQTHSRDLCIERPTIKRRVSEMVIVISKREYSRYPAAMQGEVASNKW